jgi:hypothetical protein
MLTASIIRAINEPRLLIALMMEAVLISETSVSFYEIIARSIREYGHIDTRHR